eukprot:Skav215100  [mRNA]  locus=scaffold899:136949:138049:- [translate_table: standard]
MVHFVVAFVLGPVCVDFSLIGNKKRKDGPSYKLHKAYYKTVKKLYEAFILENVAEYSVAIIRSELGPNWEVKSVILDPRVFGHAACRARVYAICFNTEKVAWVDRISMEGVIEVLTASVAADASIFWWQRLPKSTLTPGQETKRFLSGDEMIASQVLPVTKKQSLRCGGPMLELESTNNSARGKMAGNSMSAPCVGAVLLIAALALEKRH